MNKLLLLSLALSAAFPVLSDIPNPLVAPAPRVAKGAAGAPGAPGSMPTPTGTPVSPMPMLNSIPSNFGRPGEERTSEARRTFAVTGAAIDMQRDWFVSAIVGDAAILRQRGNAPAAPTTSQFGATQNFGAMYNQPGNQGKPDQAPTDVKATYGSSITVGNGEETFVMGLPVKARVQGDMVSLTWMEHGTRIVVFQGGVEPSLIVRSERKTTETPDASFSSSTAPGAAGSSSTATASGISQPGQGAPQFPR